MDDWHCWHCAFAIDRAWPLSFLTEDIDNEGVRAALQKGSARSGDNMKSLHADFVEPCLPEWADSLWNPPRYQ
eukprot:6471175-Amphidinium_carterae.1